MDFISEEVNLLWRKVDTKLEGDQIGWLSELSFHVSRLFEENAELKNVLNRAY